MARTCTNVCECPSMGPLTVDLLHSIIAAQGAAGIWEMRKGCGPLHKSPSSHENTWIS